MIVQRFEGQRIFGSGFKGWRVLGSDVKRFRVLGRTALLLAAERPLLIKKATTPEPGKIVN
jgi:hypothetical protein